jgi:hypothetical protein
MVDEMLAEHQQNQAHASSSAVEDGKASALERRKALEKEMHADPDSWGIGSHNRQQQMSVADSLFLSCQ